MTEEQLKVLETEAINQAVEEFKAEDGVFYGIANEKFEEQGVDEEGVPYGEKTYEIEMATDEGEDFTMEFIVERAEETISVDTLFSPDGTLLAKKLTKGV